MKLYLINHSCNKNITGQILFFTKKITEQILVINKYQENTRQIFINNTFNKKETNICNWCIKKVRDRYLAQFIYVEFLSLLNI